ncbi:MAG: helix-turn-helix transcriptional regulator [Proteobacteria bacterium]|nr:helix-turn-helix transcriptional regulator [Pseudomonadota bacterium]
MFADELDFACTMKHELQSFAMDTGSLPPQNSDPFFLRVLALVEEWIDSEWDRKEAIRAEARALGWNAEREAKYKDAILTSHRLASALDGMSEATFRRELERLGAPTPGEIIRKSRLRFAAKLLTHTRLRINQVGRRAGYQSEKHFTDAFRSEFKHTPTDYRRRSSNVNGESQ